MMKKRITLIALLLALFIALLPALVACDDKESAASGGSETLVIYNWEDYIDPGDIEADRAPLIDDFCAYYKEVTGNDLKITYTTFDTNETMMTKVQNNDANVDLICPSEYAIEKLLSAGLLQNQKSLYEKSKSEFDRLGVTLDGMSSLGNGFGNIEPAVMEVIKSEFGNIVVGDKSYDMTEYMVPYMYGTLGILYNKNYISEEDLKEYGWGILWNVSESETLENKILMKDSVRDTYAAALFYMYEYDLLPEKYDYIEEAQQLINITDDEMLELAEQILTEQRDHISGYEVDFGKDDMINEIVYADFAWSGDALWAVEESYDEDADECFLGYYCPSGVNPKTKKQRFSNIWYDGWVIPNTVKNTRAALMFIDYMCRPESAIRNSVAIGYTCAVDKTMLAENDDVLAFLEEQEYDTEEYFDDIGRYPVINKALGVMRDFGSRNDALVNMWQRAKSGSGVDASLGIIVAVIVVAVALALGIYFLVEALRSRPRKIKQEPDRPATPSKE